MVALRLFVGQVFPLHASSRYSILDTVVGYDLNHYYNKKLTYVGIILDTDILL